MARKRLVAPEFFKHGELFDAEESSGMPLAKAFQGLWCQADRRGLFAWRPRDLRMEIFPYGFGRAFSTMPALCQHGADPVQSMTWAMSDVLAALCAAGFVEYFEVDGKGYGRIPSFHKWQTFHVAEKPNRLIPEPLTAAPPTRTPPPSGYETRCQHGASTVLTPCQHSVSTPVTVTGTGTGTVTGTVNRGTAPTGADDAGADSLFPLPEPVPASARRVRPPRPRAAARPTDQAKYPHFTDADRRAVHDAWTTKLGTVEFPRLVAALGPAFRAPDDPAYIPHAALVRAVRDYAGMITRGRSAPFAGPEDCAKRLGALAQCALQYADDPSARSDAVAVILHGRAS